MYSVNGIPLDNPAMGWVFRAPSRPLTELVVRRPSVTLPGRLGVVRGIYASPEAVTPTFVVQTPRENLEALYSLFMRGWRITRTDDPTRNVLYEFLSATPEGYGEGDKIVDLNVIVRFPEVFWRATDPTTSAAVTINTPSQVVTGLFPGLSGDIVDPVIRLKGAFSGLQVTDSGNSWFSYSGTILGSQYLRFDAGSGRAWVTTTDTWSGGTEVSGSIDFSSPGFRISPHWPVGLGSNIRDGRCTVATATRSGMTFEVRGNAAYVLS